MKGDMSYEGPCPADGSEGTETQDNDCESKEIAYVSQEGKDRINEPRNHIKARTIGPYDSN